MRRAVSMAGGLFLLAGVGAGVAAAEGAIAIGLPANVAKDGVAVGTSYNYSTPEGARARAMEECLSFMEASAETRRLCAVVQTFTGECVAVALDPKAGTPGFGWAVAPTESSAQAGAMDRCGSTAGRDRRAFCQVTLSKCDRR